MKAKTILLGIMLLELLIAIPARAQTAKPAAAPHSQTADAAARKQLAVYMANFRNDPGNAELRDKIIALAKTLKPAPVVPLAARTDYTKATAQLKAAAAADEFKAAASLFEQVAAQAPWYADAYSNAATAYAKAGDYENAKSNLALYRSAARPGASTVAADELQSEIDRQQDELKRQQAQQRFRQALQDFQVNLAPDAAREQLIKQALEMKPAPEIPDEARKHMDRGIAAVEGATDGEVFCAASAEFASAAFIAPWLGDAYRNLAITQDKCGQFDADKLFAIYKGTFGSGQVQFDAAIKNLHFYLLTVPSAADEAWAKSLINKVEYRKEKEKDKVTAQYDLETAIHDGNVAAIRSAIARGADVNYSNPGRAFTELTGAAANSTVDVVRVLLDSGADVNAAVVSDGNTALMSAAKWPKPEMVRFLIEKHANVNARTTSGSFNGWTALTYAIRYNPVGWTEENRQQMERDKEEVIRILKDAGAQE